MANAQEVWISSIDSSLDDNNVGAGFMFAENETTHQMSIEPIEALVIYQHSETTLYFSARSLGRRVRGYYSPHSESGRKGRVTMTTLAR